MSFWELLQQSFVQNLIVVGIFIALCTALIGVPLVLKRYSLVGMGLSNVAFVGLALSALVFGLSNDLIIVMPLTIVTSILLLGPISRKKVKGDASLAMLTVGALAVGFIIISIFSNRGNFDINSALFGAANINLLRLADVWISIAVTFVVVGVFVFLYNRLFAVTFDSSFMQATNSKPAIYEYIFAIVVGVVVAMSMQLVGSLLTAALIIFPALSAMRLFKSFKSVSIAAAIIGVASAILGIFFALLFPIPVGATIIAANIVVYIILFATGLVLKRL